MKLIAIVPIKQKVFAIRILLLGAIYFSSCTSYEEKDCDINQELLNDVVLFLVKSDTLIFKGFSNKNTAVFHVSYILKDSITLGELPPPPMGGTIIISSLLGNNKFNGEDISFFKCQIKNIKKNEEQVKNILKNYKKNVNHKNQIISFGVPFFSIDEKTAYIKVDLINYGDIDGGHGHDLILHKIQNKWSIIAIHNTW